MLTRRRADVDCATMQPRDEGNEGETIRHKSHTQQKLIFTKTGYTCIQRKQKPRFQENKPNKEKSEDQKTKGRYKHNSMCKAHKHRAIKVCPHSPGVSPGLNLLVKWGKYDWHTTYLKRFGRIRKLIFYMAQLLFLQSVPCIHQKMFPLWMRFVSCRIISSLVCPVLGLQRCMIAWCRSCNWADSELGNLEPVCLFSNAFPPFHESILIKKQCTFLWWLKVALHNESSIY